METVNLFLPSLLSYCKSVKSVVKGSGPNMSVLRYLRFLLQKILSVIEVGRVEVIS